MRQERRDDTLSRGSQQRGDHAGSGYAATVVTGYRSDTGGDQRRAAVGIDRRQRSEPAAVGAASKNRASSGRPWMARRDMHAWR
jgi:hypothetical protein